MNKKHGTALNTDHLKGVVAGGNPPEGTIIITDFHVNSPSKLSEQDMAHIVGGSAASGSIHVEPDDGNN